ncbi:dihydrolipoamide acetyltransferase family protein [Pusillimonas noertemannii]|uniref:dihydrolipoamide acetyltransferase family protein n=1 Tax=Pusillimonas noertemannii TaxID=305977 RepID=UPI003342A2A7
MEVIEKPGAQAIPLTGLRGAIARGMQNSWQAPHVTLSLEANAENFERERQRHAVEVGEKISVTACLIKIAALTLRDHPGVNARISEKQIDVVSDVNIGIAVDLNPGLMVPVLKNVPQRTVADIADEVAALAEGARIGSLTPGAYQGGTFTVSSLGATEVEVFTPLLNPPQVAVLGVTRIRPRPVVEDGAIVVRKMMGLHLSFDHRALDGAPGGRFLTDLKHRIEAGLGL